jgi:hypothetical protein
MLTIMPSGDEVPAAGADCAFDGCARAARIRMAAQQDRRIGFRNQSPMDTGRSSPRDPAF